MNGVLMECLMAVGALFISIIICGLIVGGAFLLMPKDSENKLLGPLVVLGTMFILLLSNDILTFIKR